MIELIPFQEHWVNRLSALGLDVIERVLVSRHPLKDAWCLLQDTYTINRDCLGEACHRRLTCLDACPSYSLSFAISSELAEWNDNLLVIPTGM
jgi:polyferredoxin